MMSIGQFVKVKKITLLVSVVAMFHLSVSSQKAMKADKECMKKFLTGNSEQHESDAAIVSLITSTEFDMLFAQLKQTQQSIPEKVTINDSLISFAAGSTLFQYKNTSVDWYGYAGFLGPLGLHMISHSSAEAGIVSNWFVNDLTGDIYHIPSPIDEGLALAPVVYSGNKLVFFGSSVFDDYSVVEVYHIDHNNEKYCLKRIAGNIFENTRILEIADTGKDMAIMYVEIPKAKTDLTESLPKFEYYKLTWPNGNTSPQNKHCKK